MAKFFTFATLLLLTAGGWLQAWCGPPLKPGTEVFAVEPAKVLEVSYRSSGLRLIAHRWNVRDRFMLLFMDEQHRQPALCPAGPGFEIVLKSFTSLKLLQTWDTQKAKAYFQKKPLPTWAELVIRDNSQLDPFRALITPVEGSPAAALVHFAGQTYLVAFDATVFKLISGGCQSLSEPPAVEGKGKQRSQPPAPSLKPP